MKTTLRILAISAAILAVAGGLTWGFLHGRAEVAAESANDAPIQGASHITQNHGQTTLAFDEQAQRANGIVVRSLASEKHADEEKANGVILQLQPLLDFKISYNNAIMEIAKARAAASASHAEYERLSQLNKGEKNVSDKAVEAARVADESDAASLANAQQSLQTLNSSMLLRWGPAVSEWLEHGSAQLDSLLAQHSLLVQVAMNSSKNGKAPAQAMLRTPTGEEMPIHLVSVLPQLDSRIQAPTYLYLVTAKSELIPGMTLTVSLPAGPLRDGVVVPASAVVWWQGQAWCYVEIASGKFARTAVPNSNPLPTGWFLSEGVPAGSRVVTGGAQSLLSEEMRSQIQADQD